jgi:hypothetical protein
MNDFVPFPPPDLQEALYIVGFRLDPDFDGAQFYTLVALEGENERPLMADGRIVFFANHADAKRALALGDDAIKRLGLPSVELEMLCDLAQALYVANAEDSDSDGALMDAIACMDDLLRAIQISVPAEYMATLSAIAGRLSETQEFGSWIKDQGLDRERIEDALLWCIGAVASKSKWV